MSEPIRVHIRVLWLHDHGVEPVEMLSELDEERYERTLCPKIGSAARPVAHVGHSPVNSGEL